MNECIKKYTDRIIHGDCLKLMDKLPAGSVDMILTDPPYGIANEIKITRGRNGMKFKGSDLSQNFGDWDVFGGFDDYMAFTARWVCKAVKALRPGGMFIVWFDKDKINFISRYLQSKHNFKLKGYYADCKSNPVPQARKVKWMNGWEIAGMWQKPGGMLTYNYQLGQQKDYGVRPIVAGKERTIHPTQKPLSIAKLFISYWSCHNDIILDPFCGSGTSCVAAEALGRRWIGIEADRQFCRIARERIRQSQTGVPIAEQKIGQKALF